MALQVEKKGRVWLLVPETALPASFGYADGYAAAGSRLRLQPSTVVGAL